MIMDHFKRIDERSTLNAEPSAQTKLDKGGEHLRDRR